MLTFLHDELGDFLQANHTCPTLAYILLDSLGREVDGGSQSFQHRHGVTDPRFDRLLQAQTDLGWSQLFQGRLSIEWSRLQEEFLATHNDDLKLDRRYFTGAIWARKLISLLWLAMRAQWTLRNADRHGTTTAANHAIRHARLLQSLTALYNDAPLMLAADRAILAEPLTDKIKQHPSRLSMWLQRTRAIVTRSKADAQAELHRTQERLTHFFRYRRKKKPSQLSDRPAPV
jgi:hypothetical protein